MPKKVLRIFNMLKLEHVFTGHEEDRVWSASWSPCGNFLASSGEDRVIRIWSIFSKICISTLEDGQSRTIRSCAWSPDGKLIASASFDGTIALWETQDSSFKKWDMVSSLEGHDNEVKCCSWNSDGRFLASSGRDKRVWIWEKVGTSEFECVAMLDGHSQDVKCVKWHPSLDILFSTSYDDSIKVWIEDGDDWYCKETLDGHASTVWSCCISADGNQLVTCSGDQDLIMWESSSPNGIRHKAST